MKLTNIHVGDFWDDGHGRYETTLVESNHEFPSNTDFKRVLGFEWGNALDRDGKFRTEVIDLLTNIDEFGLNNDSFKYVDSETFCGMYINCINYVDPTLNAVCRSIDDHDIGGYEYLMNH